MLFTIFILNFVCYNKYDRLNVKITKKGVYDFNKNHIKKNMDTRPIGMFDSGCGGLTVLNEYTKLMPNEDFIYYGDTAHLPYGDKSKNTIIKYAEEIVEFLLKKDVKMIIIACGTASALAYPTLKEKYNIEIKNIIEPTAKEVKEKNIGIIATKATITSKAWEKAILQSNSKAQITSMACPLFVPLIEEGFINTPATDYIAKEYLKKFQNTQIESLILGCTHYPILEEKISQYLPNSTKIINTGKISAIDTLSYLKEKNMQNLENHQGTSTFYVSDDLNTFKQNARKIGINI